MQASGLSFAECATADALSQQLLCSTPINCLVHCDPICIAAGAREVTASSAEDLLKLLDTGALTRATSGTLLNEQSSRSHAIYTIVLEQRISRTLDSTSSSTNSSSATASDSGTGTAATSSTDSSCSSSGGGSHGAISEKKPHSRTACADTRGDGGCAAAQASSTAAGAGPPVLLEYRCSKFHLVDLAGSERASRSGVGGMRFKETVNINQVLRLLCGAGS